MKTVKIVACLNLKGGCGKTSLITNLGGVLKEKGHSPVLIDLDPQNSAKQWEKQGDGKFPYPVHALKLSKNPKQLRDSIENLAESSKASYVLLDCPPELADPSLVATLLSDLVLIPITPSPLDIWAAKQAVDTVKEARAQRGNSDPKAILIPSRLVRTTLLAKDIKESLLGLGELVGPGISQRVALIETVIAGTTINHHAPNSPSHKEFMNLAKYVLTNLRK